MHRVRIIIIFSWSKRFNFFFHYADGESPRDHVIYKDNLIQLSQGNFIVMCVLAGMGIVLCFGFLYFNVANRNKR